MSAGHGFAEHWLEIPPERMERYETMYRWSEAAEAFHAPARIGPGMAVADFGCGPGHAAIEFARRTAPGGHVHALDINAEFVRRTRARAKEAGLGDRITAHLLTGPGLPLPDRKLDRVTARNTLIYVPDPDATLRAFRRCLQPGGLAHAIEGDWALTLVEPIPQEDWQAVIDAADWAWPWPRIGRALYGHARDAGFAEVTVRVMTAPDTTGRLDGMLRTVLGHARQSGRMPAARLDAIAAAIAEARAEGRYLAIAPQFVVTAVAPA